MLITIIAYICGECPKPELLKPCVCDKDIISCGGSESITLKTIFHELSPKLEKGKKHFQEFHLTNKAIEELPENTFEDITFDKIEIRDALNLSLIHTNAFTATEKNLKELLISNTSLKNFPPIHDIFRAISSMVNIERFYIFNSLIEEIPDNAFRPVNGSQNNLKDIGLYQNKITKIGNNAFKHLNYLLSLGLEQNKLDHISENAFSFEKFNDNLFGLFLYNNSLNSSSFESGAFDNLNRPTAIHFNFDDKSNGIKYLDERIFQPFINNNNKNQIFLNTIDCNDCRSFWLIKNQKYSSQITDLKCSNSKLISDNSSFTDCVN